MEDPEFRTDLYRGVGADYERYRPPYPPELIADLALRVGADGSGRLLDVGCGTGFVVRALRPWFRDAVAIDQEPDMIAVAAERTAAAGVAEIDYRVVSVTAFDTTPASFDLVTFGNAFHRVPRRAAAERVLRWLRPGGELALLWGGTPWHDDLPWVSALATTAARWRRRLGVTDRIPSNFHENRERHSDQDVLREAGFEIVGHYDFPLEYVWTLDSLVGYFLSTAVLPRHVLGPHLTEFRADLGRELSAVADLDDLREPDPFSYDLARAPG
jgi:SAM-dependent methyltransferase